MDNQRSGRNQDRLNLLGGQCLLVVTFVLNVLTTFGAIWTLSGLRPIGIGLQDKAVTIERNTPFGDVLSFDRDVAVASLLAKDRLGLDEISNEMISFVAHDGTGTRRASLSLNPDYISMQANSYGASPAADAQYAFRISRELEELKVLGAMQNVRSLRPLDPETGGGRESSASLAINSREQLELSGNLGLGVHSKLIDIESGDGILIESKEGSVEIRSALNDFKLPDLHVHSERTEPQASLGYEQEDASLNAILTSSAGGPHLLCIRKSDGMVYKARSSCE